MIGMFGAACVLGIAAIGSAIGIGYAGQAAIGAWKRCYMNNKPAPFILTVFAMAASALFQGKAGAAGSDALGETGKGFAQYIMVVGLCETVALFAMVFSMIVC